VAYLPCYIKYVNCKYVSKYVSKNVSKYVSKNVSMHFKYSSHSRKQIPTTKEHSLYAEFKALQIKGSQ